METTEKNGTFFRFEELRIYAKATAYSQWLLQTMHLPVNEAQKNLFDAFCHSSYDIALNIAEGSSRNKSQPPTSACLPPKRAHKAANTSWR